jgi:hypothetical protein
MVGMGVRPNAVSLTSLTGVFGGVSAQPCPFPLRSDGAARRAVGPENTDARAPRDGGVRSCALCGAAIAASRELSARLPPSLAAEVRRGAKDRAEGEGQGQGLEEEEQQEEQQLLVRASAAALKALNQASGALRPLRPNTSQTPSWSVDSL